eukprot:1156176-Pelagomonas_calceolata.AAC.1
MTLQTAPCVSIISRKVATSTWHGALSAGPAEFQCRAMNINTHKEGKKHRECVGAKQGQDRLAG